MNLTLLLPDQRHPAIEERYASWQSELLLRSSTPSAEVVRYDPNRSASSIASGISTDVVLVVTNPLLVPSRDLVANLLGALNEHPAASAALPVANESPNPLQQRAPARLYLTLRQFQEAAESIAREAAMHVEVSWDQSDPAVFLASTESLRSLDAPLSSSLANHTVVIASNAYVHRYSSHRGQLRGDLLERVRTDAARVLEFGCGEAALGLALKQRQQCRVVGIELDPDAASIARERIDRVIEGDVREIVETLDETFDCVVGGDILEHLDDPWTFLQRLRRVTAPGGELLLSIPNVSAWPVVMDLLRGRFDYVYMGITCAGHVRFFTRKTLEEMLAISGWGIGSITPQELFITPELTELEEKLAASGIPWSREDLLTPGYYVVAVNDRPA